MINGCIKFFDESQFVYGNLGVSIEATSGDEIAHFAIDTNPFTAWQSVSSTDLITETLTLTFPQTTLDRLLFRKINWKEFSVQYDAAGIWTHFSGVSGLDAAKANLSETTFADDTAYYEFAEVETTSIRIQVVKTQSANAQKYVYQILGFLELGTLQGYPDISPWGMKLNQRSKKMLSGKHLVIPGEESYELKMGIVNYPPSLHEDLDLIFELWRRRRPFHIWPCGGKRGSSFVRYAPEGFRLQDIYKVQIDSDLSPGFMKNLYRGPVSLGTVLFRETGGHSSPEGGDVSEPTYNIELSLANNLAATEFLVIDKADYRSVIMKYHLWRKTSSAEVVTTGENVFIYRPTTDDWIMIQHKDDDGTDDGVTWSISNTAGVISVRRATDNMAGTGYDAGCRYSLEYFDA